jgi:hypothetical protein
LSAIAKRALAESLEAVAKRRDLDNDLEVRACQLPTPHNLHELPLLLRCGPCVVHLPKLGKRRRAS